MKTPTTLLISLLLLTSCTTEVLFPAWRPGDTCARPMLLERPARYWKDVDCADSEDVIATVDGWCVRESQRCVDVHFDGDPHFGDCSIVDGCCDYFVDGSPDPPDWCDDVEFPDP